MQLLRFTFIWILLFISKIIGNTATDLESYGKFKIVVTNYTVCPGFKLRSNIEVNASWVKNSDGTDDFLMEAEIKKPIGPLGVRIKVFKFMNNIYKMTLQYRIQNVCSHFLARDALKYMPEVDSKCFLPKGHVLYGMRDYDHLMHVFLGDRFFYGRFRLHVDYFTDLEEIVCNDIQVNIVQVD